MEQDVKEGIKRKLTLGEIALARQVFGSAVNFTKVMVHCDSYFPFGLQDRRVAMAPNGELWFRKQLYRYDFSSSEINDQHIFIHEMAHIWQRQQGMWVRTRGLFS